MLKQNQSFTTSRARRRRLHLAMSNGMFGLCIEHEIIASTYLLLICPRERETSAYHDVIITSLYVHLLREDVARARAPAYETSER